MLAIVVNGLEGIAFIYLLPRFIVRVFLCRQQWRCEALSCVLASLSVLTWLPVCTWLMKNLLSENSQDVLLAGTALLGSIVFVAQQNFIGGKKTAAAAATVVNVAITGATI